MSVQEQLLPLTQPAYPQDLMADWGIDQAKRGYRTTWQLFTHVAAAKGVEADEPMAAHFASNLGMFRAIDDLTDQGHAIDVSDEIAKVASGQPIEGVTDAEASLFSRVMSSYDPGRRQRQIDDHSSLPAYAALKRNAATVEEFIDITFEEAAMLVRVLSIEPVTGASSQTQSVEKFNRWLKGFFKTGYMFDGFFDLPGDRRDGNVNFVNSDLSGRMAFARTGFVETWRALRDTPVRALPELGRSALCIVLEKDG